MLSIDGYVMNTNTKVARVESGRLKPLDQDRMPLYLQTHDDLEGWLESRAIDRHRPNSRILKKLLRLTDTSDVATVLRAHAATVTDHYWVKLDSEPSLMWSQVLFRDNAMDEVALTGSYSSYAREFPEVVIRGATPELTNVGSYEKCWRREKNGYTYWYLYKQGTLLERFSELFTCKLGNAMGFHMAMYSDAAPYIKTQDFTAGERDFEPAAAVVGEEEDYAYNYDAILKRWPLIVPEYLDIIYMDALVFNVDRHTENYGFLREPKTGQVIGMAPNFDNNMALIARGYGDSPLKSNNLLIEFFTDLLKERQICYQVPALERETVERIAAETLPNEDIDRGYVVDFVMDRYQRLAEQIHDLNKSFQNGNEHDFRQFQVDEEWEP